MDPKSTPPPKIPVDQALRAHAPSPSVKRLNPKAVSVLLGIVGAVLAGRMILEIGGDNPLSDHGNSLDASHFRPTEDAIERGPIGLLPQDYAFLKPAPLPPPPVPIVQVEAPAIVEPGPDPDELRRREQLRRENELALDSPIQFQGNRSRSDNARSHDPRSGHARAGVSAHADLGRIAGDTSSADAGSPGLAFVPSDNATDSSVFANRTGVRTYVRGHLEIPRSPYEIKAGTVVPAALVTAINSDLPGDIIGQVTTNVYDSVTGRYLLIPQGTRLIGQYDSEVRNGQNRILVAWRRLILPNGNSIVVGTMPGTDAAGIAGMADRVDYHLGRLAAATLLSTFVSLGGNFAANGPDRRQLDVVGTTVAQQASGLGQRIIDRELSLEPTIRIRAGMEFNVLVTRDLILAPFERVRKTR